MKYFWAGLRAVLWLAAVLGLTLALWTIVVMIWLAYYNHYDWELVRYIVAGLAIYTGSVIILEG